MTVCRACCFTLNNPADIEDYVMQLKGDDLITYAVIGEERGEQGTLHLQGYVELARVTRLTTMFRRLLCFPLLSVKSHLTGCLEAM